MQLGSQSQMVDESSWSDSTFLSLALLIMSIFLVPPEPSATKPGGEGSQLLSTLVASISLPYQQFSLSSCLSNGLSPGLIADERPDGRTTCASVMPLPY
jgi:hypothetical protein